jgi:hypothetical protein
MTVGDGEARQVLPYLDLTIVLALFTSGRISLKKTKMLKKAAPNRLNYFNLPGLAVAHPF